MFNVGDEVICVNDDDVSLIKGNTYTISRATFEEDLDEFFVCLSCYEPYEVNYCASRFKLKSFVPSFKKGDKIVCISGFDYNVPGGWDDGIDDRYTPRTGTVYTATCDSFEDEEVTDEYVKIGDVRAWRVYRFKLRDSIYQYGYFPELHKNDEQDYYMFGVHN